MSAHSTPNLSSLIDESARRRFESAWRGGQPQPIESFLPPPGDPLFPATLEELVHIDLEMRWKSTEPPEEQTPRRLEDYLARFPCLQEPTALLRLVRQEIQCRRRHGERPIVSEYRSRFPNLVPEDWEPTLASGPAGVDNDMAPIPGYEILGVLGRGGMGVVLKARQLSLNRIVALKRILGAGTSTEDLTRFRGEAEAIARLQHANIVQVYEVGQVEGRPYFSLEYVDGGTLAQKLNGTPQAPAFAARTVATLARTMHAVHLQGVLHRDLKPSNVLVKADGTLKITDFGLAKNVEGQSNATLTQTGIILGTPSYMAPEQAAGQSKAIGAGMDVYALGAILYEMLTGRPPFRGATAMETVYQVVHDPAVTPRRLVAKTPRDLETICLKCLEKRQDQRYASALALAEDLERFSAGEPIHARPISRSERLWRWCRRKPAQASLSAALLLALIGAVAGLFYWQAAEARHQQEAQDFVHRQEQDEQRRLGELRAALDTNCQLAQSELQAGHFTAAEKFFRQALEGAQHEAFADRRRSLADQHDRLRRLVQFSQLSDKAERMAFFDQDDSAMRLCELGLKDLGVFEHKTDWWRHLPSADLSKEQAEKLQKDVNHQLMLLAGLQGREGMTNPQRAASTRAYRSAIDLVAMVQAFHKEKKWPEAMSGRLLEMFCHLNLLELSKVRNMKGVQPYGASDCYFLGIASFWMAANPDETTSTALRVGLKVMGVDLGDLSSHQLLRRAAAMEPKHYWTHFWLGWSLIGAKDYLGAELAFTTCITLRPKYALSYAERARALSLQMGDKNNTTPREELRQRCLADLERAARLEPHDSAMQFIRLYVYADLQMNPQAVAAATRWLELTPPLSWRVHRRDYQELQQQQSLIKDYMTRLAQQDPNNSAIDSTSALVHFALGSDSEAMQAVTKILEAKATPAQSDRATALAVRSAILLRQKQAKASMEDAKAALALAPNHFLAAASQARAREMLADWPGALADFQALDKLAVVDWQHLESYLGQARVFNHLARFEEADAALQLARDIDPRLANELAERLAAGRPK